MLHISLFRFSVRKHSDSDEQPLRIERRPVTQRAYGHLNVYSRADGQDNVMSSLARSF